MWHSIYTFYAVSQHISMTRTELVVVSCKVVKIDNKQTYRILFPHDNFKKKLNKNSFKVIEKWLRTRLDTCPYTEKKTINISKSNIIILNVYLNLKFIFQP